MGSKYKLIERKSKNDEKEFRVYIETDYGDGDFIDQTTYFNEKDFNEILPFLIFLKEKFLNKNHAFDSYSSMENCDDLPSEYDDYDDDQFEELMDEIDNAILPSNEYGHGHTLEQIDITMVDENGTLFDVEI